MSPPGNVLFSRIRGGPRAFNFACCARAALAIPFTLSEALAIFPHTSNNSPGRTASSGAVLGHRQGSRCIDVTEQQRKRIKGAAGRRAAVAAAAMQLQLAREAAIAAKARVSVFRGVLYLNHCRALKDAEDADDVRAVAKPDAQGVCAALRVCWLHPAFRAEAVQAAFEAFGPIKSVRLCDGPAHAPKTTGRLVLNFNYAIIVYRDKSSAAAARDAMNGATATFDVRVRAEALMVGFASGEAGLAGDRSDDEFCACHGSGPVRPDDPESDGTDDESLGDSDDFDGFGGGGGGCHSDAD